MTAVKEKTDVDWYESNLRDPKTGEPLKLSRDQKEYLTGNEEALLCGRWNGKSVALCCKVLYDIDNVAHASPKLYAGL